MIDCQTVIAYIHPDYKKSIDLIDYKFYCFNGKPHLCQVITDRRTEEKIDFYDMEWNRIEGLVGLNPEAQNSKVVLARPLSFDVMKRNVAILSKDISFSRIDFYDIQGKCYFGEITFFPGGGFGKFRPDEWDIKLGELIKIDRIITTTK